MKSLHMTLLAVAATAFAAAPAFAQSAPTVDQCTAWMTKADTNADGSIGAGENTQFIDMMNKGATTQMSADSAIDKQAWMDACQKGTFGMPPS